MDPIFTLKLLCGAVAGSLWVLLTLRLGAKGDHKIAGIVGGLPSTVLLSYLFIGWTQGTVFAFRATETFPLTYAIGAMSALLYLILNRGGVILRLTCFLVFWIALQGATLSVPSIGFMLAVSVWLLLFVVTCGFFSFSSWAKQKQQSPLNPLSKKETCLQVLLSASIIAAAIAVSEFGSPSISSIFAAFPGIYLSTLVSTDLKYGLAVSRSIVGPMIVAGLLNCVLYVVIFRGLILSNGYLLSTVIAAIAVLVIGTKISGLIMRAIFRPN